MAEIPEFVIETIGPVRIEKVTDVAWLQRRLKEVCRSHAEIIKRLQKARKMLREEHKRTTALLYQIDAIRRALE